MKFNFAALRVAADVAGAAVKDQGNGHWVIVADYLVNFYPYAKNGASYHIAGTSSGRRFGGEVDELVQLAFEPLGTTKEAQNKARCDKQKRRLLREDAFCKSCKTPLTLETARLVHIIPPNKGGADGYGNLWLVCGDCDTRKGNDMKHGKKSDGTKSNAAVAAAQTPPEASPPAAIRPASGPISVVQVTADDADVPQPHPENEVASADERNTFTVIGYWTENRQLFNQSAIASSVEHAIELARLAIGDTDQMQTSVVDVVVIAPDGSIKSMLSESCIVDGPVGTARISSEITDAIMGRYSLGVTVPVDDLVRNARHALNDLITIFGAALGGPDQLAAVWKAATPESE